MRVRPAESGTVIRDPNTRRPLPDDGDQVPNTTFWHRRILAGEVVVIDDDDVFAEPEPTGREPVTPLTTRRTPEGGR